MYKNLNITAVIIFMFSTWSYAQIGIGTDIPDAGSILDVTSSNKGVLIPRVDITDLSTIAPITGGSTVSLLVYNTNVLTGRGFHYWDGVEWIYLVEAGNIGNIYSNDDSLAGDRMVTQNNFNLNFDDNTLTIVGSDNRIGIGTNSPESNLHIKTIEDIGDAVLTIESDSNDDNENDNVRIELMQANKRIRTTMGLNNNSNNEYIGALKNTFFINSFGTSPSGDHGHIQFATGGTDTTPQNSVARMTILNNGNVGINTNAPTQKLSVVGTTGNTSGVWLMNSDIRIKNIGEDFTDGLGIVNSIHPVNYTYKANAPFFDGGKPQIGIIAQELEKIAPYMVSKTKGAGYSDLRTLNPQAFPYLLINAVQQQQVQIEERQKEIEELKDLVKELIKKKN